MSMSVNEDEPSMPAHRKSSARSSPLSSGEGDDDRSSSLRGFVDPAVSAAERDEGP
jgi:hypothetical protein